MNVMVTLECRFDRAPDGTVWSSWGQFLYPFFARYLEIFDQVFVAARLKNADRVLDGWKRADGPGVSFMPIPYYLGPMQYAFRAYTIQQAANRAVHSADAAILRVPSIIAGAAERALKRNQRPYGLEVVSDPFDVFAPCSVKHPLRPLLRIYGPYRLKRQCRDACAVAYVTKEALQKRYPTGPGVFHSSYSDVELGDEAFASAQFRRNYTQNPLTLIHVGTFAQLYKAPDVLLEAFSRCMNDGMDLRLTLIGDGQYRHEMEKLVARLQLSERVLFTGQLPGGQAVRDQLDQAHLFVLASRTEGLPRAMVEAMARGLPCIGSMVGGIPELLDPDDLVFPGDASALAAKIREIATDPHRMVRMSVRNFERAQQYHEHVLCKARIGFYRYVRERTEEWKKIQNRRTPIG